NGIRPLPRSPFPPAPPAPLRRGFLLPVPDTAAASPGLRSVQPVARLEVLGQACLGAAGLGLVAVFPAHPGRPAHPDRFGPSAGLQAEVRAPVPDQVELDIAPAAIELELAFALPVLAVLAALDDRQVGIQEAVAHRAHVAEVGFEVLAEVIEEQ